MEDQLEAVIADLVERKNAAREGSAEYRMAIRQLSGLRYTRELAGPMPIVALSNGQLARSIPLPFARWQPATAQPLATR